MPTPPDLADVVADLKVAFLVPPDELTTRRHLAALAAAGSDHESSATRSRRSRRRRILVPIGVTGGLILATSGLAAADVLPAPVQRAVAAVAAPFGIDLHATEAPEGGPTQPDSNESDDGDVTPAGPTSTDGPAADESNPTPPVNPSQDAPGHGGTNPGKSDQAPGQQKDPGQSGSAPGHGGPNPGKSDQAPGRQTDPTTPTSAPQDGKKSDTSETSDTTHGAP